MEPCFLPGKTCTVVCDGTKHVFFCGKTLPFLHLSEHCGFKEQVMRVLGEVPAFQALLAFVSLQRTYTHMHTHMHIYTCTHTHVYTHCLIIYSTVKTLEAAPP